MTPKTNNIVGSEVVLKDTPVFSTRSLLNLEQLMDLVKVVVDNKPIYGIEAIERSKAAIAELELNSGFHSILVHLREVKRLRALEPIHEMNLAETNKQLFNRHVRNALNKGGHTLTVMIEMPDLPTPEKIVNPPENVELKMAYYLKNYDDDLRLKSAPHIRISGFELAREGYSGTGILFSKTKGDLA